MKILDTNGLDYMVKGKVTTTDRFYITPDIEEEFEAWHEQKMPKNVQNIFGMEWFDRATYLRSYKEMINMYGGRSFYNMTGFGDISILALLKTQQAAASSMIPGLSEDVEVVSSDKPLTAKIRKAFCQGRDAFGVSLKITKFEDFFRM
jgi:hypothetical protein